MHPLDQIRDPGHAVIDVRSPSEYLHGHIPQAVSMPLFSDDERAAVGTAYVQQGRTPAVELGLQIVGPKLSDMVAAARAIARGRPIIVYCWRGGMRSASVAWLLATAGMPVVTIPRGYKGYRARVHALLQAHWNLRVLAGRTGSGKTHRLHELAQAGEQVLDLEAICRHKGSSFGALGEEPQPTTEHAMNLMADVLWDFEPSRTVWVEDESRTVGKVVLPEALFIRMQQAPVEVLDVSRDERVRNLVADYGDYPADELVAAFERIRSKLGGERCTAAIESVQNGDLAAAADIALAYYDRTYDYALARRLHHARQRSHD